jgi:hypothetical protein
MDFVGKTTSAIATAMILMLIFAVAAYLMGVNGSIINRLVSAVGSGGYGTPHPIAHARFAPSQKTVPTRSLLALAIW